MDLDVEKMGAQLRRWSLQIDSLAARTQMTGALPTFDAVMYVDELKALHAIAHTRLIAFAAAGDTDRACLTEAMTIAWEELEAAFRSSKASPRAVEGNKLKRKSDSASPRVDGRQES